MIQNDITRDSFGFMVKQFYSKNKREQKLDNIAVFLLLAQIVRR